MALALHMARSPAGFSPVDAAAVVRLWLVKSRFVLEKGPDTERLASHVRLRGRRSQVQSRRNPQGQDWIAVGMFSKVCARLLDSEGQPLIWGRGLQTTEMFQLRPGRLLGDHQPETVSVGWRGHLNDSSCLQS